MARERDRDRRFMFNMNNPAVKVVIGIVLCMPVVVLMAIGAHQATLGEPDAHLWGAAAIVYVILLLLGYVIVIGIKEAFF